VNWRAATGSTGFNVLVTVIAFGLTPFLKKMALVNGLSPWNVALVTACFAGLASLLALGRRRVETLSALVAPGVRLPLAVLGAVATGVVTLLVVQALTVTTATNRSLFQSAYPAATLLFAHLLLGERLGRWQYVAVAALMIGLLLMNGDNDGVRFGPGFWLLAATLPLIGISDVYSKRLTERLAPGTIAAGRNLYGALFLLLVVPWLGSGLPGLADAWLLVAAAGLLQGVGVWTLYRAMNTAKASLVAAMVASSPLLTLAVERQFLGLTLSPLQWSGLALVLVCAVWLGASGGRRAPARERP
jgi:drug/metabolite transporter (DMT)-like permease